MTDARRTALDTLVRMQDGSMEMDQALAGANGIADLSDRDRAFAASLVHNSLRFGLAADALLARYIDKPIPAKRMHVHWALRMGVVQLLAMDVPAHAAVSTTVALIKRRPHEKVFSGLANAVLKKLLKENATLDSTMALPQWMMARWQKFYGEDAVRAMGEQMIAPAMLDITVPDSARRDWYAARWNGKTIGSMTVRLPLCDVTALDDYAEGKWWVQDVASTIPIQMLGDVSGKTILELCAAPGGKTAQLCAAGAAVTALDRSPLRMKRLRENMARLKCSPMMVEADMMAWENERLYEVVVLDAPCSASGTIRRHPEMLWQRKESQIAELAALQSRLMHQAWQWVLPHGGKLLYAVCSLEKEEGEAQVAEFLRNVDDAILSKVLLPANACPPAGYHNGLLRLLPHYWAEQGGMDGFFAALIEKR